MRDCTFPRLVRSSLSALISTFTSRAAVARPWRLRPVLPAALAAAALVCACAGARAATCTVSSNADTNITGTLRYCLNNLASGTVASTNVISFSVTGTITLTSALPVINDGVTITGPGANELTISGANSYLVFSISGGNVNLSGLTVANGNNANAGALFDTSSGTVIVNQCAFVNNTSSGGLNAGAITFGGSGTMDVENSTFTGNSDPTPGGSGAVTSSSSTNTLNVVNSTFYNNSGTFGGGVGNLNGPMSVVNSTFYNNNGVYGEAIYASGTSTVANSVFVNNTGGTYAISANEPNTTLGGNVYWNNAGGDCFNCTSAGGITDSSGGIHAASNPLTLPLGYYGGTTETFLPQPGSQAICAGSTSVESLTTDQRGFAMDPIYSPCALGAVDAGAVQTNYIEVQSSGDGTADASNCQGASCRLRDAIALANSNGYGDIDFKSGVSSITLSSSGSTLELSGSTGINILGPGANALSVSGGGSATVGSVFTVDASVPALLYGLTVTGGNSSNNTYGGGGIYSAGTLTVLDSAVSGNTANSGYNGGGILSTGALTVTGSTVSGNRATGAYGGGIASNHGTLTVTESTIYDNQASGNGAGNGGGIFSYNSFTLTGSTVSDNSATCSGPGSSAGGGIYDATGTVTLANSIVAGNSASATGGGFAENADIFGNIANDSGNLYGTSSTGSSNVNPELSPLQYNGIGATLQTAIPLPGSPAICAGLVSNIPAGTTTDERGYPLHPSGGYCTSSQVDAGAVQTNYTSVGFVQQPTNVDENTAMSPAPTVQAIETDTLLTSNNTDAVNVDGMTATLGLTDNDSVLKSGSTQNVSGGVVAFNGLEFSAPETNDTLTASLTVTPGTISPGTTITGTSNGFDVYGPPTVNTGGLTVTYYEGTPPLDLDDELSVNDASSSSLNEAQVSIASGFSTGDTLYFTSLAGITGSYNSATGVLTLTGSASPVNYQSALRSVTFSTTSTNTTARIIDWSVTDSNGLSSAIVTSTVDIQGVPTVTAISPNSGPTTGGTNVTITGTYFTGATGVTIGGTAATNVVVVNATTITATTPLGSGTNVSVAVTTPVGTSAAANLFTYVPVSPTVSVNAYAITYGTALSNTQLSGTATYNSVTVPGTFTFTSAAGTVLNAGANQSEQVTFTPTNTAEYANVTTTVSITVNQATPTVSANAYSITYGTALSNAQLSGTASFTVNSLPVSVAGTFTFKTAAGTVLGAGPNQSESVTFTPTNTTDYTTAATTVLITVNQATLTITANNATKVYGTANPTFTGSVMGQQNNDSFTESFMTAATVSSPVTTYAIVPSVTGSNLSDYTQSVTDGTLTITQAASTTTLGVSSASITPGQSVTLTATVIDASLGSTGTPTGTVNFYDGGTLLNSTPATLSGGVATYATTTLAPGVTHVITATYSGSVNFAGSSYAASAATNITVAPLDFTMTLSGPGSQTVIPGSSISYQVTVTPDYGSYAGTVNFAVSGLPAGATVSFSPSSIAANGGPQTVTITIQTAPESAAVQEQPRPASGRTAPLALALLGLFGLGAMRKRRRALKRFLCVVALLAGGAALTLSLNGCGGAGFFAQAPQSYTVTITATASNLQHSTSVTMNVE